MRFDLSALPDPDRLSLTVPANVLLPDEQVTVLRAYDGPARLQELFVVELPVDSSVPPREWVLSAPALVLGD